MVLNQQPINYLNLETSVGLATKIHCIQTHALLCEISNTTHDVQYAYNTS